MPFQLLRFTVKREGCNGVRPLSLGDFMEGTVASFKLYDPVASQDNYLALCRRSWNDEGRRRPDLLRVCNPLTGEWFHIPELISVPPNNYALLVATDISLDGHMSQSFLLVAVWIVGKMFIYLYYCSKTREWWMPTSFPQLMPDLFLLFSSAVASNGGIHWLCGSSKSWMLTHVVTLHVDVEELSYLELPSEAKGNMLLANSADGCLLLLIVRDVQMSLWKHKSEPSSDNGDWILSETIDLTNYLPMPVIKVQSRAVVRLEIFRGKSGTVVLWIEGEGLFLFSLSDQSVRKLDNERITKNCCICAYEIDWLSCLAVTNLVFDDSSLLDVRMKQVQRRWRTLWQRM
ncbi:hypothetical protein ACP70R_025711 [Stipagrostis hirtigluma subsp. patula]